jgi:uncharacterized protein
MSGLDELKHALPRLGAEPSILDDARTAHVVAHGHRILSRRTVPGLRVELDETPEAIVGRLTVDAGVRIERPIHLCFGLADPAGVQQIRIDLTVREGAQAQVLSHCLFPVARAAEHRMQAVVAIEDGASLSYIEAHYHGPHGGMRVLPHATIRIGRRARYFSDFSLLSGAVGSLDIDYRVEVDAEGVAELSAKIFAHRSDRIALKEAVILKGERSHGLIRTRAVVADRAQAEITGITKAYAPGAHGAMWIARRSCRVRLTPARSRSSRSFIPKPRSRTRRQSGASTGRSWKR